MKRPNTLSLTASKTEYPTSKTIKFLGSIQKPELVDAYKREGRQLLSLDKVKSGGNLQTRSQSVMKQHIKELVDLKKQNELLKATLFGEMGHYKCLFFCF